MIITGMATAEQKGSDCRQRIEMEIDLSLRDLFAAFALAGMASVDRWANTHPSQFAESAYEHADAMIAERQKIEALK